MIELIKLKNQLDELASDERFIKDEYDEFKKDESKFTNDDKFYMYQRYYTLELRVVLKELAINFKVNKK